MRTVPKAKLHPFLCMLLPYCYMKYHAKTLEKRLTSSQQHFSHSLEVIYYTHSSNVLSWNITPEQ